MKLLSFFIIGIVLGSLVEVFIAHHPSERRYQVMLAAPSDGPALLIKVDTATGKTWHYQGGWLPMLDTSNVSNEVSSKNALSKNQ
jgi:hypothetical protein